MLAFLQTTRSSRSEALSPGIMNSQLETMRQVAGTGIGGYCFSGDDGDETGCGSVERADQAVGLHRHCPLADASHREKSFVPFTCLNCTLKMEQL
jgi:hypothetical protein